MISFRYHVVSIVSVLLALAVGVVLGGGPLRGRVDDTLVSEAASDRRTTGELQGQVSAQRARTAVDDRFVTAAAPRLVAGSLRGHEVTLVVLPTAGDAEVRSLRTTLRLAGGSVGAVVTADEQLVDPGGKQLVEELGLQLQARTPGLGLPRGAGTYERIGTLLGRALGATRPGGAVPDSTATSILAGLDTAGLLSLDGPVRRRGDLVLFATGAGQGSVQAQRGAATIVRSLVRSVDARTGGVVLAGPAAAARPDAQVDAVRSDPPTARRVSTVDSLDSAGGAVAAVLALAGQAAGRSGHYGGEDAPGGALPVAGTPRR